MKQLFVKYKTTRQITIIYYKLILLLILILFIIQKVDVSEF